MNMKRYALPALVVMLLTATGAYALPQLVDMASTINGVETLPARIRTNTAATGTSVDIANPGSAMMVVMADSFDAKPTFYVVLQDSATAWANVDSVRVDSAAASAGANGYLELGYRGSRRYLRAVQRATGNNADSLATGVLILRGRCRVQPC